MNETPLDYLMIDIANHYGLDKAPYHERIAWVKVHIDELEQRIGEADKPELYTAAVLALRDSQMGKPTGHMVGFDAAASGLQIMAAITNCRVTAENTGLIGHKRGDIYTKCTETMSDILGQAVQVSRKDVKAAQMPHFYGSKKRPKEIFGDGTKEFEAFHEANYLVAPRPCELLEILLKSWQPYQLNHSWYMPDGYFVHIPVMVLDKKRVEIDELGSSVTYAYRTNAGQEKGLSNAANIIHSIDALVVRELVRRCSYKNFLNNQEMDLNDYSKLIHNYLKSPKTGTATHYREVLFKRSLWMSFSHLEHINEDNIHTFSEEFLRELVVLVDRHRYRPYFDVITVHDEFKCHPLYMTDVRMTYREIMSELCESSILIDIMDQIDPDLLLPEFPPDPNLSADILTGTYAIT